MSSKGQRSNHGTLRNHIIPMFHMRHSARNTDDNDVVYLYDLKEAGRRQSYSPKQLTVENAEVQKGFYSNDYESTLAEEFESPAAAPIRKLTTDETITLEERVSVAAYLMSYQLRSHSMRKYIQELYIQSSEDYLSNIKEHYSSVKDILINRGEQIDEAFFVKLASYEGSKNEYEQWGNKHFAEGQLATLEGIKKATILLASLKWRLFTSDSQPFVLSDTFFAQEGPDQPFYELYAPLASNTCLFISRYIHDLDHRWTIERIPIDPSNVRAINVRTAKKAEKYIVSGTDKLRWLNRARKTPDRAHSKITIPGIANPRILNEFVAERCPNCWHSLQVDGTNVTFHKEVGAVTHGKVMINTSVQSQCSHCDFSTDFKHPSDRKEYPIGVPASQIRSMLIPGP